MRLVIATAAFHILYFLVTATFCIMTDVKASYDMPFLPDALFPIAGAIFWLAVLSAIAFKGRRPSFRRWILWGSIATCFVALGQWLSVGSRGRSFIYGWLYVQQEGRWIADESAAGRFVSMLGMIILLNIPAILLSLALCISLAKKLRKGKDKIFVRTEPVH
jgi:hypothetical protein